VIEAVVVVTSLVANLVITKLLDCELMLFNLL
jgi:hypothetical protein